jgi:cell fate regulator YaaT (PSP1 superfamily)
MPICAGVAFKRVAKSYWFDPGELDLEEQDRVVVETTRGLELGTVKIGPRFVPEEEIQAPLKRVLRRALPDDLARERQNREKAKHALTVCLENVKRLELPMKLLQAEYTFDGDQVTIYFAAENRVDFRELVREVAGHLRCKVQLHQVGARDQAKMIGSVGPCGRTLCCSTFLTEFAPISMKMAKDQALFLNPVKFSGVCGKLMCCLRYEHDTYVEAKKRLPQIGNVVMTARGQGKVMDLNLLKETALVQLFESQVELEFPATELQVEKVGQCSSCRGCSVHPSQSDAEDGVSVDDATRTGALDVAAERARNRALDDEEENERHADL